MICIYKIVFKNNDFYIGQTTDFDKRKKQHLNSKGTGSPLLQKAFELQPDPDFHVVEETTQSQLDSKEIYWIEKLKPPLNTLLGGKSNRGLYSPRLKYTKEQIEDVVYYWCNTTLTKAEIRDITKVNYSTVCDILAGRSHHWATENIDLKSFERKSSYKIYDPLNNEYCGSTIEELSDKTGLSRSSIHSLVSSKSGESRSGWSTFVQPVFILTSPDGEDVKLPKNLCKTLLEDSGLSPYQVERLIKHNLPSGGWKIITCPQKGD
jgi:group I intron endonuclease